MQLDRLATVAGDQHTIAIRLELGSNEAQHARLVIDDQDGDPTVQHQPDSPVALASASGSVKRNAAPCPGRESSSMRPPWSSTNRLQIARPRPAPATALLCGSARKKRSKTRWWYSGATPGPSSFTVTTIEPSWTVALTSIRPVGGE